MTKLILEKKINTKIMTLLLYVSFCAAGWYSFRGTLALFAAQAEGIFATAIIGNDVVAFFIAGLISILLYELITRLVFRFLAVRLSGSGDRLRYALRFFMFGANVLLLLLHLLYIPFPLLYTYGEIFFAFVVITSFLIWFLFFIGKHYIEKRKMYAVAYHFSVIYLSIYAVIAFVNVLMEVL